MTELRVAVTGLAEFNKGLRQLDKEAPKGLRLALNEAAELLVSETRSLVPRRTGAAAGSLRAASTRTSARVKVGGPKAPYYPWLDFGGRTGRRRSAARPFIKEGRYLFPTLSRIRPRVLATLDEAIRTVARDAGLDVS